MDIKAFHFDMKGMIPKAEFMLKLLPELSRMGYNAVLVEFEDKFPYESLTEIVHPDAWSREEFSSFRELCGRLEMQIIPLVQCAGHLDYVLKHDKYRHLRDGNPPRETTSQWCLADPAEPFAIWQTMTTEILEFFPGCRYFHIGADEFNFHILCSRCSTDERFDLFIDHVIHCTKFVKAHGKKVIVWDDTFRKRESAKLDELLPMVIPCVWQYLGVDEKIVEKMCAKSPEVWGASKIQNDERYRGMGRQSAVEKNVNDWCGVLEKFPLKGHIGTIWGRNHGLSQLAATLPQSFYMLAYLAYSLNHGKITDREKFRQEFVRDYFGLESAEFIGKLGTEPVAAAAMLAEAGEKVSRNKEILEIYTLFNKLDSLWVYCDACFGENYALYPKYITNTATDELTRNFLDGVRITQERADELKAEFRLKLGELFTPALLEEYISSRFDGMLEINTLWGKIIRSAYNNKDL
ncbi:MAG: hypothetical protein E7050_03145 [Lentisphaerae bacterium]|nr:hypothetical protein [Lentisphaerota bacterium]